MVPAVTLAAEGRVDFAILRRLVTEAGMTAGSEYGSKGKGDLDSKVPAYNDAARYNPWVVLRDMDRDAGCPQDLVQRLLPRPAELMIYRIVVRAAEAWLIADKGSFCERFRVAARYVPDGPESVEQPKAEMLRALNSTSVRSVREATVRLNRDGNRSIGPEYNALLVDFVDRHWRPHVAAERAPSLARARARLVELRKLLLTRSKTTEQGE